MTKFRALVAIALMAAGCTTTTQQDRYTDPQIAMVMRVLNLSEVREGELARDKADNAMVREFAQKMINEHDAQNNKAESAMAVKDINSEDTPLSRQLDAASGAAADRLRALSGPSFDRAYVDREVEAHQSALNLIDKQLTPNARNKVVKAQLTELRKLVDTHLTRIRQIRLDLEKRP